MQIVIFEDEGALKFLPLVYLKPVYELRVGMRSLKEKFEAELSESFPLSFHVRCYLGELYQEQQGRPVNSILDDDVLFLNGRVICDDGFAKKVISGKFQHGKAYFNGGQLVAFRTDARKLFGELPGVIDAREISQKLPVEQVDCSYVAFMWDLIRMHPDEFRREAMNCRDFGRIEGRISPAATLVNEKHIYVAEGADVRAGVVIDAEEGFVYLGPAATVLPNAVLMDNVYVGSGSTVKIGAKIYSNVYIGSRSKVGGEVEDSIIEPYANKQHDGFLGHSYISSWCNLGADTNNSDLKNNYGTVRMSMGGKEIDTKMQFLGLLMGEHSKSGINSMFNTGTIVGLSSNVFGAGFPPKYVGSFEWGGADSGFERYRLDKALEVARAVMARRRMELSPAYEAAFRHAYALETKPQPVQV
ncbi:MAG: transferase [Chlorobiales bacterium]|nr:transferase [Chlorobiales bacterium]